MIDRKAINDVTKMSAEDLDLFAYWLEEEGLELAPSREIPKRANSVAAPLSFRQQRLWFLEQLEGASPIYNISTAVRIKEALDVPSVEDLLKKLIERNESLRTTVTSVEGNAVQVIAPAQTLTLDIEDLTALPDDDREASAIEIAAERSNRPFDLGTGPLLRALLMRLAADEYV